jgi:hypothetical protein
MVPDVMVASISVENLKAIFGLASICANAVKKIPSADAGKSALPSTNKKTCTTDN